ncbi:MAG: D-aminoacylase, partial [Cyclobacteriaceae bacterium]
MTRICLFSIVAFLCLGCQKQKYEVIIRGGMLFDGSGNPGVVTDLAINADTIAFVGDLSEAIGAKEVNGNGLILAPGFIDTHSHHDRGLSEDPSGLALVSQGITTIIV